MDSIPSGQVWRDELPRKLTSQHTDEIHRLALISMDTPWKLSDFAFFLGHPAGYSWAAVDSEGEIQSCLIALLVRGELDIITFMTHPNLRRRGLAKNVLSAVAKDPKVKRITLEVDVTNLPAYALYKSLGFQTDCVRKRYYENKRDAYLMSLTTTKH